MNALLTAQPPCLPEIVERISRKFHPVQIILFGSWARGEAREDSDVDLLVVLSKVEHKRKAAIQIGNSLRTYPKINNVVARRVLFPTKQSPKSSVLPD